MKQLKLSNGTIVTYSDEDHNLVAKYNWCYSNGYVVAKHPEKNTTIRLHRLLLAVSANLFVDHKDGNPLNNCRENLRIVTHSQNMRNSSAKKKITNKTSMYKGVSLCKATQKWKAQITCSLGFAVNLGRFKTELEAAIAYNIAAIKEFGEYAKINTIQENQNETI